MIDQNTKGERILSSGILTEVFRGEASCEVSGDYIIPDYVSDVQRVLLCTGRARIDDKYSDDEAAVISGDVTFYVLLLTEGGAMSSLTFSEPFEIKVPCKEITKNCLISVNLRKSGASCRLINPRKLGIKAPITADTVIFSSSDISPTIIGSESPSDCMTTARKTEEIRTARIFSIEESDIHVSHDIELDSGYPSAEEIILCRIDPSPSEVRVKGDEANVRTDVRISLIYLTEENEYFCADKKIILEHAIQGIRQDVDWVASITPSDLEAKITTNAYGERKIIEIDFDYDIEMTAITSEEATTVSDMYSTEYECNCSFEGASVTVFKRLYQANITVNASSDRSSCGGDDVKGVFTGVISIKDSSIEYNSDKGKLSIEGTAVISVVCLEGDSDGNELYKNCSFEYPFKIELEASEDAEGCDYNLELFISDAKFRCDSQKLYADFEITARAAALGKEYLKYLSKAEIKKDSPAYHSPTPITLCYPSRDDTLWDIAKYYGVTEDSIILANALESRNISGKKVLLIPKAKNVCNQRDRAV